MVLAVSCGKSLHGINADQTDGRDPALAADTWTSLAQQGGHAGGCGQQVVTDQQAMVKVQIILPMAVMFSLSLILSNIAYVHLSVSFVQMLKVSSPSPTRAHEQAFIPILVLIIQLAAGLQCRWCQAR
jgi:hypothetical protein